MGDIVEDDDKWLYGGPESTPTHTSGYDKDADQSASKQADDLSQIFDNQVITHL